MNGYSESNVFRAMKMKANVILAIAAAALTMNSCQKVPVGSRAGEAIRFTVGSEPAVTKASYSGDDDGAKERIDWTIGDQIRIYCADASEPADLYADYLVSSVEAPTSGSPVSKAAVRPVSGDGLVWSEENTHVFYGVYPSPAEIGSSVTSIIGNVVLASIPASQPGQDSQSSGNHVVAPNLKNMVMTSRESVKSEDLSEGDVFLHFTPLTTAIKFVLKNGTGSALSLSKVQLISGKGKATAPVISGNFDIDLDVTAVPAAVHPYGDAYTVTWNQSYPLCTRFTLDSTDEAADRTLTIPFSPALSLADQKTLTFTFFLNPVQNFSDLYFQIVETGGASRSIRLGYTDGSGVYFPRHKKSTVQGLVLEKSVVLSFDPDVIPWDDERFPINPGDSTSTDPVIVDWEDGEIDSLTLTSAGSSAD